MTKRLIKAGLLIIIGLLISASLPETRNGRPVAGNTEVPIYLNTSYTFEERAADLVSRMTLLEKQSLLGNTMSGVPRLGINPYQIWGEALHGVAGFLAPNIKPATSFPNSVALGASWDPVLMQREAAVISKEARAMNTPVIANLTYWSPVVEPMRDPRWGRTGESFGEDPFLIGQIAGGFIRGMMGNDPVYLKSVPTAKHYFANNSEFNRHTGSSDMDGRDMREFYLAPYKKLIERDRLPSIMTAYNSVNGTPMSASKYFVDTLARKLYGLKAYITGDCGAIQDIQTGHFYTKEAREATALGLKSGVDCDCGDVYQATAADAVKTGLLSEADIDKALVNLFTIRMRMGEFDPSSRVPYSSIQPCVLNAPGHTELAVEVATRTPVLLKNSQVATTGKKALPLNAGVLKKIFVTGPKADVVDLGPYSGRPLKENLIAPLAGIKTLLAAKGSAAEVVSTTGANTANSSSLFNLYSFSTTAADGLVKEYDATEYASASAGINVGEAITSEKIVRGINGGSWVAYNNVNISNLKSMNLKLAVNSDGGIVEVRAGSQSGNLVAVFEVGPGIGPYSSAIPRTESAKVNQLGAGGPQTLYFVFLPPAKAPIDNETLTAAAAADAAIVFVGTDDKTASEEADRYDLLLPGNQVELIKAVAGVNPYTVVVIQSLGMVEVDEFKDLPGVGGIIWTGFNGQAQGTAMASILFGDVNPGGKLNATWYKSVRDLPPISDYNLRGDGKKPGRTYWYYTGDVSYEFGFGLSYTSFEYSNFSISKKEITPNDRVSITVDVKNMGPVQGDEVVQVYVRTPDSPASLQRPVKKLKGFQRVTIPAGQTKTVTIPVSCSDLWFWDEQKGRLTFDQGRYLFEIGSSSKDIRGSVEAAMTGSLDPVLKNVVAECGRVILKPGDNVQTNVTASLTDDTFLDTGQAVIRYSSNNPDVAGVDEKGLVTAKNGGVAAITAHVTWKGRTVTDSYPVKVMKSLAPSAITVNGRKIAGYSPDVHSYSSVMGGSSSKVPQVGVVQSDRTIKVETVQAAAVPGTAVITLLSQTTGDTETFKVSFGIKAVSEEFGSAVPGRQWSWVRENSGHWSLTETPGSLTITAANGDLNGSSNNAENLLLQSANTDWTIESKMSYSRQPSKVGQQGGIIAYQDDDNYIKLVYTHEPVSFFSGEAYIALMIEDHGMQYSVVKVRAKDIATPLNNIVFRLAKKGDQYEAYYSKDGKSFTPLGSVSAILSDIKAGIIVCNGSASGGIISMLIGPQPETDKSDFKVKCDYFHIVSRGSR